MWNKLKNLNSFMKEVNSLLYPAVTKPAGSGYTIPRFVYAKKSGFLPWLLRKIGRLFLNVEIYKLGLKRVDMHKILDRIIYLKESDV